MCTRAMASRKKRRAEEGYLIRSLAAPMRLMRTGELCSKVFLAPGTALTFGRSKVCDVIFEDVRVSRKHCQLQVHPVSNSLILLDGASASGYTSKEPEVRPISPQETPFKRVTRKTKPAKQEDRKSQGSALPLMDKKRFLDKSFITVPNRDATCWKPSLNGIFVNGCAMSEGMMVLKAGDEVSLVGPTEAGCSLDLECHLPVGFVAEMPPTTKKVHTSPRCLSSQSFSNHAVRENFSAEDMFSSDLAGITHCSRIISNDMEIAELDPISRKQGSSKERDNLTTTISSAAKPLTRGMGVEPEAKTGNLSSAEASRGSTNQKHANREMHVSSLTSDLKGKQLIGSGSTSKQTRYLDDLDSRFVSTFDLVNASMKLRLEMLASYMVEASHDTINHHGLVCLRTENDTHHICGQNPCSKALQYDTTSRDFTKLSLDGVFTESQGVDNVSIKGVFTESQGVDNVSIKGVLESQGTLNSHRDNALFKETGGVDTQHVAKMVNSVRATMQDIPLNAVTLADQRTTSHEAATLLISQSGHTSSITCSLHKTLQDGNCRSFPNQVLHDTQMLAITVDLTQDADSENSPEHVADCSNTLARELLVPDGSETQTLTASHNVFELMVKAQIGVKLQASAANVEVAEVKSRVKKEALSTLEQVDDSLFKHEANRKVLKYDVQNTNNWPLFGSYPVKEGSSFLGCEMDDVARFHSHGSHPENSLDMHLAGSKGPECKMAEKGFLVGDEDVFLVKDKSSSLKNDGRAAFDEKASGKPFEFSDMEQSETLHNKVFVHGRQVDNINVKDQVQDKDEKIKEIGQLLNRNCIHHRPSEMLDIQKCGQGHEKAVIEVSKLASEDLVSSVEQAGQPTHCSENFKASSGKCGLEKAVAATCPVEGKRGFSCKIESSLKPAVGSIDNSNAECAEVNRNHISMCEISDCTSIAQAHGEASTQSVVGSAQVLNEVREANVLAIHRSGYCLNRLKHVDGEAYKQFGTVSLCELLAPIDEVQALFIATFTYDIEWFLSFADLSRDIPVTIACHDARRCWSAASKDRYEKPYEDWPNVTLVYPPFPRSNSFGKGQGIGCHHPKIFLLRHAEYLRVIVSSANLTLKQWFHVTNNVWWQDFPSRQSPNFRPLFRGEEKSKNTATPDFASHLARFLAALLADVPSEAHWVTDLATFDFSDAAGSLIASVPGTHQPLYHNAPQFLMTLNKESYSFSQHGDVFEAQYLGIVPTTVAGIRYRFCASADCNGTRIRTLAAVLNSSIAYEGSTMPVLLKRVKILKADPNAVGVIVASQANVCSQDLFLQEDLHDKRINTWESDTLQTDGDGGFIKLGFLPKTVASWLAVLCDRGYFSFAACIWPKEALAVASAQSEGAVKLALYVFQGPKFSSLSPSIMTREEHAAISSLLKSLHHTWGLWRLEKVLSRYNWVDSHECDFYVASSSLGTSLDARFLAAFAAAAGRRAVQSQTHSQESDPQWGCWTAKDEAINPSIGIIFPTIERVKRDNFSHYGLLCFAESAWLRLKAARLLHDAVPCPPEREGFPMHIKIARRRFQDPTSSQPYGWLYCGSHNFSPAAWGRPIWRAREWEAATNAGSALGSSLHILNYEVGIVLMEPPSDEGCTSGEKESDRVELDRFVLPFRVPPPAYMDSDRPATGRAMMEAFLERKALQMKATEEDVAVMQSEDLVEEVNEVQEDVGNAGGEESRAEQVYVEALWSQIDEE